MKGLVHKILVIAVAAALIPAWGCSRRAENRNGEVSRPAAPGELPELPQNSLYKINGQAAAEEPDTSFQPVSNDLQPVPADAQPTPLQD